MPTVAVENHEKEMGENYSNIDNLLTSSCIIRACEENQFLRKKIITKTWSATEF